MTLSPHECIAIAAALMAIMMAGSTDLRMNLWLYRVQTLLLAVETALFASIHHDSLLYWLALALAGIKAGFAQWFLNRIRRNISINNDPGIMLASPLAMHLSIVLLGASYLFTQSLPLAEGRGWPMATASISLLFTGLVLMLTRRIALSQIIGFLVVENGIYLFALTQTSGMPMLVEMGILLDVLVGVMITGLLVFQIKRSFEHIDVTLLAELKE